MDSSKSFLDGVETSVVGISPLDLNLLPGLLISERKEALDDEGDEKGGGGGGATPGGGRGGGGPGGGRGVNVEWEEGLE